MFDFLLTASYCATWLYKLIPHIHLKIPNSCDFLFFNRHIFSKQTHFHSIGTSWVDKHIFGQQTPFVISNMNGYYHSINTFCWAPFHSIDTFFLNRHSISQQAPFGISNMKGHDLRIYTFWQALFRPMGTFLVNSHIFIQQTYFQPIGTFWHTYYNLSYIYLYIQHKLTNNTLCDFLLYHFFF